MPDPSSAARIVKTDRRAEKRETMVLRVGLLEAAGKSAFCLVKNISSAGVQVKLYGSIAAGCEVLLKVGDEGALRGRLIWAREDIVGIKFEHSLDPSTLLRVTQKLASSSRRSSPRVNAPARAILRTGGRTLSAELCDISVSGAKIRTQKAIKPGPSVLLTLPGLPTIRAHVRWAQDDELGLFFDCPLPIQIIASWLSERVRVSS